MKGTTDQVVETIRASAGENYSADTVARVAWASITDPDDAEVGRLIEQRGAVAALEATLNPEVESIEGVSLGRLRDRIGPRTTVRVAESLEAASGMGWSIITPLSREWPGLCNQLGEGAPLCLWVAGDPALLTRRMLALTGSTTPTAERVCDTLEIATASASRGWVIAAGAGAGIETCGHRAGLALRAGTIAVMPCGIDQGDPACSEWLLADIEREGAVVSEFAPGTVPTMSRRARRDRLIAALTTKVVVVDAETDSDATLIGEEARKLGRPVGVLGSPDPALESSGCRQLRRWFGARVVSNIDDIDLL